MLDKNTPVRIHKSILLRHPAAKLWYVCRAADSQGRGRIELSVSEWQILKVSKSTIYRWLREGRDIGLFRIYEFRPDGSLYVSLGGLPKVCKESGIASWGPVTTVPLGEILDGFMRSLASAIQTQDLQEKSRYTAGQSLNDLERRCFKIPTAVEILSQTSPKLARGVVPGLVHTGPDKLFVGRSFIPFGASQERICTELNAETRSCGVTTRTLRNHLKRLGVDRRQLVQAKPEYKEIGTAIGYRASGHKAKGEADIWFHWEVCRGNPAIRFHEPNGKSSATRVGGHLLQPDRFFRYFGADWIYRCNLYSLVYDLTSMKRSRSQYKRSLAQNQPNPCSEPVSADKTQAQCQRRSGRALGNQNKEEKNDNSLKLDLEPTSPLEIPKGLQKCREQIAQLMAKKREFKLEHSIAKSSSDSLDVKPDSEQYQLLLKACNGELKRSAMLGSSFEMTVDLDSDSEEYKRLKQQQ